jgi:hypothetical protein
MAQGAYIVRQEETIPREIYFTIRSDWEGDVPDDQVELHQSIEQACLVLRNMFGDDDPRFSTYFAPLLALSQAGLVGPMAQPKIAKQALQDWKANVLAREAGRVKNGHMKILGLRAIYLGVPAFASAIVLSVYTTASSEIINLLCLWGGCMAGVWLSFGIRKTVLRFEDLHIPEEDRLEPAVRLLFAGILTVFIGLLFITKAVSVTVGAISSSQLSTDLRIAIILGMVCGISELALSSTVTQQASRFVNFEKVKDS